MALTWATSFNCTVLVGESIFPNKFNAKITFDVVTTDYDHQMIAIDRMKFFLQSVCAMRMMVSMDSKTLPKIRKITPNNQYITVASHPSDEIIAAALLSKMISITEGKLDVYAIELSSEVGGDVVASVSEDELGHYLPVPSEFFEDKAALPWWLRSDAGASDLYVKTKSGSKVESEISAWSEYLLSWDGDDDLDMSNFVSPPKVPTARGFNPKIIDGGKK